jgi:hypothetical protein
MLHHFGASDHLLGQCLMPTDLRSVGDLMDLGHLRNVKTVTGEKGSPAGNGRHERALGVACSMASGASSKAVRKGIDSTGLI